MNSNQARAESCVATAHRAVWHAMQNLDGMRRHEGSVEDLRGILTTLESIQRDMLRHAPARHHPVAGQLRLDERR